MAGLFIVFEGVDFSGKTTQVKLLAEYLQKKGHIVVATKEPGGTPEGEKIRERLQNECLSKKEELDLFLESRRLHVGKILRPALASGKVVICDRFSPSTIAYQGAGIEIDAREVLLKDASARGGLWPDIIFYLDGDYRRLKERAAARGGKATIIENRSDDFFIKVRESFLAQARADKGRWHVIDALLSAQEISQTILARLEPVKFQSDTAGH